MMRVNHAKKSIPDVVGVITLSQRRNKFDMFSRLEKKSAREDGEYKAEPEHAGLCRPK